MLTTRMSLLDRVRDPDDGASWREFVELYRPLLVNYARKRGLEDADADDVVQDILIALVRRLPEFELDKSRGRFRTYLYTVTVNTVRNWARKRNRGGGEKQLNSSIQGLLEVDAENPDEEWMNASRRRVLQFALSKVHESTNEKTWACFEGRVLNDRPAAEIGAELGLKPNAVYVNASRVLSQVRAKCAEYMEELADD